MVGIQAAREVARELNPRTIVITSLRKEEVDDALAFLRGEISGPELVGEWGNIFVPDALKDAARDEIYASAANYDLLFDAVFRRESDYKQSALFRIIDKYKPEIVIDCINTATGISYQNEFDIAIQAKEQLDALSRRDGAIARDELEPFLVTIRKLLISQGIPQIARHVLVLHRTLEDSAVQIYVKVGTTGTGGMGLNIPYTHSEDKPSLPLLAKSAIGFAHTGLLFLLARTPAASDEKHSAIVKEVKPGAMIGFRRVEKKHVRLRGENAKAYLYAPREETLGARLELRQDERGYERFDARDVPLEIIGADTGENGFFSIGEFLAITYPRQMEYVDRKSVV